MIAGERGRVSAYCLLQRDWGACRQTNMKSSCYRRTHRRMTSPARLERVDVWRTEMRKVITGAFVSLDGVMQAPGGPKEDPTRGFELGGWVVPYADEMFGQAIDQMFAQAFDLLL